MEFDLKLELAENTGIEAPETNLNEELRTRECRCVQIGNPLSQLLLLLELQRIGVLHIVHRHVVLI